MAKTFYTLEEAAQVLGKSKADVQKMAERGELTEFKSNDQLVFKKEQVDLLAESSGAGGSASGIRLAEDTGLGLSPLEPLDSPGRSGSGLSLDGGEKDSTGISIFDADQTETADPAAQTQVSDAPAFSHEFGSDAGSSGSGLLDLTREADDTSLGADLLEDVYGQDTVGGQTTVAESGGFAAVGGGDLFESTGSELETAAMGAGTAAPMMAQEAYDGAGSGLVGGLAIGVCLTALLALFVALLSLTGVSGGLLATLGGNHYAVGGAMAVVTLLLAGVGWFLGRR